MEADTKRVTEMILPMPTEIIEVTIEETTFPVNKEGNN